MQQIKTKELWATKLAGDDMWELVANNDCRSEPIRVTEEGLLEFCVKFRVGLVDQWVEEDLL